MIVSTIKQFGLRLRADPEEIPFQYSANVQMKFEKDENYNDYTVVGYYIPPGESEAKLLNINDDGKFILGPDCFKQRGTLSFSFNLINSIEEVHLGSIDFEVRYSFGDGDTILPEPEEVWISLVTQVAKDAIREEVALVKQKANEALQSASLANDKASEAEEYANNANQSAGSASLSASSALTAKNDAIAASNQALGFSNNASESAIEAKNSADEALENANASNKAIETVNQIKTQIEDKANEFDTNYQEKLSLFNDNATEKQNAFNQSVTSANDLFDKKVVDANNDLDSKLQQANTTIDEKVTEATEQAQKAKDEADRAEQATAGKLDKNLGAENSDKVLITDVEGNITAQNKEDFEGGGTSDYNDLENKPQINGVELKGNKTSSDLKMYTQEEVDYLLDDKMDKPYVPIEITDNATITDALEGNFKIDKIKGNTYQKVETDIVPTPNRPVPINSRKTLVTKANPNVFDLEKESDTSKIPDSGTYRSIGQYQLKANTKYIFEWTEATVPAKATLSFQVQDDKGTVLVSPFTYFNLQADEKKEAGKQVEFTTNESGIIKFAYNCVVATSSTTETYQQYWYTKILKDISLKEDVEYEPEYVELRSLKESKNLFDKNIMAFTSGTLNSDGTVGANASYAVSGFVPVRPSTQYTIKVIDGFRGSTKVYYDINKQVISNEATITFTTPSNCYFVRWQTATTDTRVLTEEDIQKINDEMMMVKGNSLPSSYVPPTVRDYKIVDHTTQTSKIVRNVKTIRVTSKLINNGFNDYTETLKRAIIRTLDRFVIDNVTKAGNDLSNMAITRFGSLQNGNVFADVSGIANMYWYPDISMLSLNGSETKSIADQKLVDFLTSNEMYVQYQLATPVEETITYVETDTSEIGYSWQDTTSPSPDIKSEVQGVEKINILKTGKNLFDFSKIKETGGLTIDYENKTITIPPKSNNAGYVNNLKDLMGGYKIGEKYVMSAKTSNPEAQRIIYFLDIKSSIKFDEPFTLTEEMLNSPFAWYNNIESKNQNVISNIQIEQSDTATAYEPYTEQHINITPQQPLYENDIANVESGEYEYNDVTYVLDDKTPKTIQFGTTREKTQLFQLSVIDIFNNNDIWCDKLKNDRNKDEELFTYQDGTLYISIYKNRLETVDVAGFKKWLKDNPLTFVGSSSSPTTQPIPEEDLAKLKLLKTEQGVTNIFVSGEVKPTINARYPRDLALVQQQLEQKVLLMSETLTATQAKLLLQGGN